MSVSVLPSNSAALEQGDEKYSDTSKPQEGLQETVDGSERSTSGGDGAFSDAYSARILRKIDWHLMPIMCGVYAIQFMDKTCLSYASIMGLRPDTGLSSSQYSWVSSIFYFGYLVWEYPATLLLQRFPLAKMTGLNVTLWGGVLMAMAACKNFPQLMVVRFFLGMLESSITPAFTMYTAQFYQKKEQGTRTGIWFSFNGLGGVAGAFIAYGLSQADEKDNLALPGWQVIFLLLGGLTVAFGVAVFLLMPDSLAKARFLKDGEKEIASFRLLKNRQVHTKGFRASHAWEAVKDYQTWLLALFTICVTIPNGAITNFASIIIKGLGYTTANALLLQAPANTIAAMSIFLTLWLGDKLQKRIFACILAYIAATAGLLILWLLPLHNTLGRLFGTYLIFVFPCGVALVMSLIASNVAGSTKKSTVLGIVLVAYCVGNLIGPQIFLAREAPVYTTALIVILACFLAALVVLALMWFLAARENRRRDAEQASGAVSGKDYGYDEDLTDKQNPLFRYTL